MSPVLHWVSGNFYVTLSACFPLWLGLSVSVVCVAFMCLQVIVSLEMFHRIPGMSLW